MEAGILSMPTAKQWGQLIADVGKGAKAGMVMYELMQDGCSDEDVCDTFISL